MNIETKTNIYETRAYLSNHKHTEEKVYKGKMPDLKCSYCNNTGHVKERYWILHPELMPLNFINDNKGTQKKFQTSISKANHAIFKQRTSKLHFQSC